ncbi:hypothetical protein VHEMI01506 [[Torrubiella] hemipterigena]|uniref:DUF7137 domain-containing protein n=1 Tax=[Torrubiella] hemipterigena TaxID=1531966 RepID=A0A0A1ST84_9HYPO|nr:hypothetical protein VHEMI01506 [[Torrubiella] hemipterigena]
MRPALPLLQLAAALYSVAPLAAAWPGHSTGQVNNVVVVRADPPASAAPSQGQTSNNDKPKETNAGSNTAKPQESNKAGGNTAKPEPTDPPKNKGDSSSKDGGSSSDGGDSSSSERNTDFAFDAGNGRVVMTKPAAFDIPLFRIGTNVTLGWNYTGLLATPTAVDVVLTQTIAKARWTLTANMSFTSAVNYVWDTTVQGSDKSAPLLDSDYQLIVKDSDVPLDQQLKPGYLRPDQVLKLMLYRAQPYVSLPDYQCSGCASAASSMYGSAVGLALTMTVLSVATFTMFVTSAGIV